MYWLSLVFIYLTYDRVGVVSTDQGVNSRIAFNPKHEKNIELFIVVDHLAYSYHGDDTEIYVIEMLKMAMSLWDRSTLGVDVGFLLTGLEILAKPHPLLRDLDDANTILMDFRRWLSRDTSRYVDFNFDIAILITRKDIHINSNFDATGKGFVGGTCTDDMKMAIVEDSSPMGLAISIAHELGHLLGMYHDYQYSNPLCPDKTFIMSGFAVGGPKSVQWSSCSKEALRNFMKGRRTNCLNGHGMGEAIIGDRTAGVRYNADFQCTMQQRQTSLVCDHKEDPCSKLFCTSSNPATPCVTDHRPPLDGTQCGENKWCQQGVCVNQHDEVLLEANNQNLSIKRFGAADHSKDKYARVFINISWKIMLIFVFIILFKQCMNILRLGSSHILYKIRNKQIQIV